jgi:DNA-binding MarR family transcriptional regulator
MTIPADIQFRMREVISRTYGEEALGALDLFRQLMKTTGIITMITERQLSKHNLTLAKLRLLFWLKMRGETDKNSGGLLPSELSKFQGIMPNTVSSLLSSLRKAGLIEQGEHISDRRKRIIKITQAGRDLLDEISPEHHTFLGNLFDALTPEEIETLTLLLNKLGASIAESLKCEAHSEKETTSSF